MTQEIILSIEDNADISKYIKHLLEHNGYQVITTENGKKGLDLLKTLPNLPDLILCDIIMPQMNGYEFYSHVSNNPAWNTIPFIFLSGKADIEDIRFAKKLGVDDYITKPFEAKDLLAIIEGKISRIQKKKNSQQQMQKKITELYQNDKIDNDIKVTYEIEKKTKETNFSCIFYSSRDKAQKILIHSYPPEKELSFSLKDIINKFFKMSESLMDSSGNILPQGILLNLVNINQMAYIFFGERTNKKSINHYLIGIFSENIDYLTSLRFQEILETLALKINTSMEVTNESFNTTLKPISDNKNKIIHEIWIFYQMGIELVSYTTDLSVDSSLLCGYLAALQIFTQELSNNELKMFQISDMQYVFYRDPNYPFYIVAKISKIHSDQTITPILQDLAFQFSQKYSNVLMNFEGNISIFQEFKATLKKLIT